MARYPNGQIPFESLVHLGGEHYLTPATARKWGALQQDVWENEGVWLEITPGANGYRWYEAQEETYENEPPGNAAYPGTSSHGGVFKGVDAMALDIENWGLLGRDRFYYYARKHGFEPNYFDWEPWHIIDWDPWAAVPSGGGGAPGNEQEEEDEMPDSMFAIVDDVPSWCWINWARGTVYSVHTQEDANWIGSYMGSVKKNFSGDSDGGTARYKNTLALLKLLNP